MKAVLCPVCLGAGKYEEKTCHGCGGKGWVEIAESYPWYPQPEPYYPPYPYQYYPPIQEWTTDGGNTTIKFKIVSNKD